MKNPRRIIGIAGALVLATVGTLALVGYVQSARDDALADEALVDVYIVDSLVPKGAEADAIKAAVSLEQVPARLKQSGAITDLAAIGTNVAATDLQPGDQLVSARLVPKTAISLDVTDKVQVSTRLAVERVVGGTLRPGDLVGVYLSFEPIDDNLDGGAAAPDPAAAPPTTAPAGSARITRLEFRHVLVTNVEATDVRTVDAPTTDDGAVPAVGANELVVTLALTPEQSERFVFAIEFGNVWLAADPASVPATAPRPDDATRPVTIGNVYSAVK